MRKIIFPASILASAATAFGLGAIVFDGDGATPATAQPQPTVTATVPATPQDGPLKDAERVSATTAPGKHAKPYTGSETVRTTASAKAAPRHAKTAAKGATKTPKAAAKATPTKRLTLGPVRDAEGDGKVLDDIAHTLPLPDVGVTIPDDMLPFPGPGYTGPPSAVTSQEDADSMSLGYNPADVVSGPNVITDPDKPWFHFPTSPPVAEEPVAEEPTISTPVAETPVEAPPVRNTGLVTGSRPKFF